MTPPASAPATTEQREGIEHEITRVGYAAAWRVLAGAYTLPLTACDAQALLAKLARLPDAAVKEGSK